MKHDYEFIDWTYLAGECQALFYCCVGNSRTGYSHVRITFNIKELTAIVLDSGKNQVNPHLKEEAIKALENLNNELEVIISSTQRK